MSDRERTDVAAPCTYDHQMRTASLVLLVGLTAAVVSSSSASVRAPATLPTCTMTGPHWTLYPAHSSIPQKGTVYRLVLTNVSCARVRGYVRTFFRRNPKWPATGALKGAPRGWRCQSTTGTDPRNRTARSGSCLETTSPPPNIHNFDFAPKASKR